MMKKEKEKTGTGTKIRMIKVTNNRTLRTKEKKSDECKT